MAFKRTPKQIEATKLISSHRHALLVGGSRSGKTFIAIRSIFIRALKHKSNHLIIRQHLNHAIASIWRQTIPAVIAACFDEETQKVIRKGINNSFYFIKLPNGSMIFLGGIDDKQRSEKILGNEYSTIYANESSQISWDSISILKTRLAEKSGLINRFIYDCNPPTKSHWLYSVFIKGLMPDSKLPIPDFKNDYGYIFMNPIDNAENIDEKYIKELSALPERQKQRYLEGLFLDDVEGALFMQSWIDKNRLIEESFLELKRNHKINRVVIGVDPAVTSNENSNLTGIIVVCEILDGINISFGVLSDNSLVATPLDWAKVVINTARIFGATGVVVEINQGGEMCKSTLRNAGYTGMIYEVRASKSKFSRAEPIAGLYEMGRVKHLNTRELSYLETEMTGYIPLLSDGSPDRMDALVWAITHLTDGTSQTAIARSQIDFKKLSRQF